MSQRPRRSLEERVAAAAEAALTDRGHVSPLDVFLGIGWTEAGTVKRWQQGQTECLEAVMQISASRMAEATSLLSVWAAKRGLLASETQYIARTPDRQVLCFSRSGDAATETMYRTQWLSPALSEKRRNSFVAQASRPPELMVIQPLNDAWKCHRCGQTGDWLIMEKPGPACLRCVGLDDLEFLPSGDALLTRRAKVKSTRSAVVVRFSRNRRRYERQGLLVEPQALAEARREVEALDRD